MPANDRQRAAAKLTRSLRVTGRRPDGYHLLDAEMVSLDFADELEFAAGDGLEIVDAIDWIGDDDPGAPPPSVPHDGRNLVSRALALGGTPAFVRLVKRIPPGAGLGGGSADAAAAFRFAGYDDVLGAASLGADVPFCLRGGRARVTGIGEVLEALPYEAATVLLLTPACGVRTDRVYAAFDEIGTGSDEAVNDLEAAALVVEPRLAAAADLLGEVTGERPQLAGSGSTWFVECADERAAALALELRFAVAGGPFRAAVTKARTTEAISL